ncbi:hypothetical protein GQX73_g213 [Xylaria multiplex]|uniref:G-protein coupled receptors family 1 profile domain-containing protein n=1 Tax=Xylaria multiplex TaxID=323545 RepID=A0A7C8NE83_9PEZI|nr:hypothetical protein GQX73_g213 [Xylaria multiplex]
MEISNESSTLTPLPPVVRSGSIAIVIFALTSFFSALILFLYLTYNIVRWRLGRWQPGGQKRKAPGHIFANGPIEFGPAHDAAKLAGEQPTIDAVSLAPSDRTENRRYPNQFIVLFLNLLIADVHQATAFGLSTSWLARNSVTVGTRTCFVQGLFVSVGDLASSCFMVAISVHTFYSIVWKYRPPHKNLYFYIVLIWAFVYLISLLPVAGTMNGAKVGGFFVRAGPWCWINKQYGDIRLLTHYIFIFIAIFVSWVLYTAVFISLRRQYRRGEFTNAKNRGFHHPVFLIYPIIYLICILPLAIGRVMTMSGREPSLGYFCASGALIASNGWLDVIVFTTTRRSIVFAHGDELGIEDTGVDTFTFLTPNTFGNTIWVRGGRGEQPRKPPTGGWWRILGDPETQARGHSRMGKTLSQTSLTLPTERNAIQMEVITTVVVEDDRRAAESSSTSTQSLKERPYQ